MRRFIKAVIAKHDELQPWKSSLSHKCASACSDLMEDAGVNGWCKSGRLCRRLPARLERAGVCTGERLPVGNSGIQIQVWEWKWFLWPRSFVQWPCERFKGLFFFFPKPTSGDVFCSLLCVFNRALHDFSDVVSYLCFFCSWDGVIGQYVHVWSLNICFV